jgi:hypothetical protein
MTGKRKTTTINLFMQEQQPRQVEERRVPGWKRWLNYQSVVRQLPFILFLAVLAVVYIYNGHRADKITRNIDVLTREVKELKWEYISKKKVVMFMSKPSEVAKAAAPLGLKELEQSPVVLKDSVGSN